MYLFNLKRHIKGLIIWIIVIIFFLVASMVKYEGLSASPIDSAALFDSMPNVIKVIYGFTDVSPVTLPGYYIILIQYFTIMLAIYSANLGAKVIYEEEDLKTSEFLFTKPVTRTYIFVMKYLVGLSIIILVNLFVFIFSYFYVVVKYGEIDNFVLMNIVQFLVCLVAYSIGALISCMKHNDKAVIVASFIVLTFYLLKIIAEINSWKIGMLSPLIAFNYQKIYFNTINNVYYIYYLGIIIILFILSIQILNRRDIKN